MQLVVVVESTKKPRLIALLWEDTVAVLAAITRVTLVNQTQTSIHLAWRCQVAFILHTRLFALCYQSSGTSNCSTVSFSGMHLNTIREEMPIQMQRFGMFRIWGYFEAIDLFAVNITQLTTNSQLEQTKKKRKHVSLRVNIYVESYRS